MMKIVQLRWHFCAGFTCVFVELFAKYRGFEFPLFFGFSDEMREDYLLLLSYLLLWSMFHLVIGKCLQEEMERRYLVWPRLQSRGKLLAHLGKLIIKNTLLWLLPFFLIAAGRQLFRGKGIEGVLTACILNGLAALVFAFIQLLVMLLFRTTMYSFVLSVGIQTVSLISLLNERGYALYLFPNLAMYGRTEQFLEIGISLVMRIGGMCGMIFVICLSLIWLLSINKYDV